MTRLRPCGATAKQARLRAFGASARHARLRLLLLVAALGFAARPAAAQTEIVEYYGHDALGSIRIVFTASGVATARADYEPFGEGVTIAGMPAGPLPAQQFTGQERDALERQDYFGARYYRPRHGRFSQVDPVWGNLFDPQQLNRYAYVGNSPLRYVDPDGRMRLDADCQQLDLTFAKCAAYKAPDSFLAGVFGWQQFLRQGPTFSGGGPGGRRPKGPTEGGDGTDDSGGIDGSGDGNSNTNTNANNTGNNSNANSGQNTGDEGMRRQTRVARPRQEPTPWGSLSISLLFEVVRSAPALQSSFAPSTLACTGTSPTLGGLAAG